MLVCALCVVLYMLFDFAYVNGRVCVYVGVIHISFYDSVYVFLCTNYLLPGLGVVVVPLGVAVDELVAVRGDVTQRPVPLGHPVRQELEQIVHPAGDENIY